jgi:lycopene beta-cyclase
MITHYDIAILGAGLAGLSTLYHLGKAGHLAGKSVVLVDPEGRKAAHDRSWSFWEEGDGPFEELVYHRWQKVTLHNQTKNLNCDISPYEYKLIRSTEFYAHVNAYLDTLPNLERRTSLATEVKTDKEQVTFLLGEEQCSASLAFSSLPLHLRPRQIKQPYLDQHFRGWFVETEEDTFDPTTAALMDFRTPQHGESRFCYVMPFTPRRALVEVAIFSNEHLTTEGYDHILKEYMATQWTSDYRIEHTEGGNIPMTTYPFPLREGNLIYIGMRGGATRPSTGYTFYALQRQLTRLAQTFPDFSGLPPWPSRHIQYDATLLRILQDGKLNGADLFVDLFAGNPPERVLAFLNGETSIWQELQLMSTTNVPVFGSTFVRELF